MCAIDHQQAAQPLNDRQRHVRRNREVEDQTLFVAVLRDVDDAKPHRIAIQVNQNDPQVMNLALNNASNVLEYYRARNQDVEIDIVTYGPGLHMLRADTSPVQDRLKRLKEMAFPGKIQFSACNNTKQGMEKAEGHAISVVSDATRTGRPVDVSTVAESAPPFPLPPPPLPFTVGSKRT